MESNTKLMQNDLLSFARELVRIQSFSGQEGRVARSIADKMKRLNFDQVTIDDLGSVLGRIGSGPRSILFESHTDTVKVHDADEWDHFPFSGNIDGGYLYGRGSVDMKSGLAASIFAAAASRDEGYLSDKTVIVSCSVSEEDCDGEGIKHLLAEHDVTPDFAVICEPSSNRIVHGHNGKAQIIITTHGVSAHGSAPEKGVNAVYEMAEIIQRVEQTNKDLMRTSGGTLVLSDISSKGVSLNAVPDECTIYLDRRLVMGETEQTVRDEMERIIQGKHAEWEIDTVRRTSWTGKPIVYHPLHMPWQIDHNHHLMQAALKSYLETFASQPAAPISWDFSTNAVGLIPLGVPCIGFGPGDPKLAHMRDERCPLDQIKGAFDFYTHMIRNF